VKNNVLTVSLSRLSCIASSNQLVTTPLPATHISRQEEEEEETHRQKKLLVSGDCKGVVRLMRYPALGKVEMSPSVAHAGVVSEVHFWHNDKFVLSAGRADGCVMIWRIHSSHHHHHHQHRDHMAVEGVKEEASDQSSSDSDSLSEASD